METVVENGSGVGARIDGYRIAGKTGTSQKAKNGVYTRKKVCSFVATLPVNDPKYVVLVVIDEPSKSYAYGATVAVPVAKEIIESLIVIEKMPPEIKKNKMIYKKLKIFRFFKGLSHILMISEGLKLVYKYTYRYLNMKSILEQLSEMTVVVADTDLGFN